MFAVKGYRLVTKPLMRLSQLYSSWHCRDEVTSCDRRPALSLKNKNGGDKLEHTRPSSGDERHCGLCEEIASEARLDPSRVCRRARTRTPHHHAVRKGR